MTDDRERLAKHWILHYVRFLINLLYVYDCINEQNVISSVMELLFCILLHWSWLVILAICFICTKIGQHTVHVYYYYLNYILTS